MNPSLFDLPPNTGNELALLRLERDRAFDRLVDQDNHKQEILEALCQGKPCAQYVSFPVELSDFRDLCEKVANAETAAYIESLKRE